MSKELEDVIKFMLSDEVIKAVNNVKTTPEFEAMIQAIRKELVRPEEPMGLGEKLYEYMSYPSSESDRSKADSLAHKARQHYFSSENEKALAEMLWASHPYYADLLAQRVCEWFRQVR